MLFILFLFQLLVGNELSNDIIGVWEIHSQRIYSNCDLNNETIISGEELYSKPCDNYLMEFTKDNKFKKLYIDCKNKSVQSYKYSIKDNLLNLQMSNNSKGLDIKVDYQGRYCYFYYKIDVDGDDKLDFVIEKLQRNYETGVWDMSMMQKYYFVMLSAGKNRNQSKEESAEIQKKHLQNIADMAKEGILYISGPFLENGDERGILIFKNVDVELIKSRLQNDPAISIGRLDYKIIPWMTEAGATLPAK